MEIINSNTKGINEAVKKILDGEIILFQQILFME